MTVAEIISIAKTSQYLSGNEVAKGSLFGRKLDSRLPVMLYCERKAVEWLYTNDSTDSSLVSTSNYLYALCGKWGLLAQAITGVGGVGIVVTSTGDILRSPIEVISSDFTNATDWGGVNSDNVNVKSTYNLEVFWNDVQRFLDEGTEWVRTATGFQIIIPGFDSTSSTYKFYVFLK